MPLVAAACQLTWRPLFPGSSCCNYLQLLTSAATASLATAVPDPNACIMRKCRVFPVEFVCRGFMTGSTDTSLWTHYKVRARWWQLGFAQGE